MIRFITLIFRGFPLFEEADAGLKKRDLAVW